jgi:uncharacterized small protein (DUF1192 family)
MGNVAELQAKLAILTTELAEANASKKEAMDAGRCEGERGS